jgi:hypothetical protein
VETERPDDKHYDVVCINCGWRKVVDTFTNPFGQWLRKQVLYKDSGIIYIIDRPHIGRRTVLEQKGKRWRIVREYNISDGRKAVEA